MIRFAIARLIGAYTSKGLSFIRPMPRIKYMLEMKNIIS